MPLKNIIAQQTQDMTPHAIDIFSTIHFLICQSTAGKVLVYSCIYQRYIILVQSGIVECQQSYQNKGIYK